jgi:hypothetical protein
VKFTLKGTSMFGDNVDRFCTTALGTCTISGVPLGTYTLDEDETTIQAGFTKDPSLPKSVTIASGGQDVPVSVVNPRSHRVITIVCHEGTIALDATDVTKDGGPTKTSINAVPAALAAKGVTVDDLCAIGGATFGGLAHDDTGFTVELSE